MLPRDPLAGEPLAVEDPDFAVAVEVAVVEEQLAASIEGPRFAFDRAHVEALRVSGATREQFHAYASTLFPPVLVARLMDDLSGYGPWSGDEVTG